MKPQLFKPFFEKMILVPVLWTINTYSLFLLKYDVPYSCMTPVLEIYTSNKISYYVVKLHTHILNMPSSENQTDPTK